MVHEKGKTGNLPAVYQPEKTGDLRIPDDVFQGVVSVIQDPYTEHVDAWVRWMDETGHGPDMDGVGDYFRYLNGGASYALKNGTAVSYKARTIAVRRQAVKKRFREYALSRSAEYQARLEMYLKGFDRSPETKAPKVNNDHVTRDRVLRDDEFRQLMEEARSDRQRGFFLFLRESACRVSEAAAIRLSDCREAGAVVSIRVMGKGMKERYVRVKRATFAFLRETFRGTTYLLEKSTGEPYTGGYISDQVRAIGRRIGRKISAHTLRHSWATAAYEKEPGMLKGISEFLGHADSGFTIRLYVHQELPDDVLSRITPEVELSGRAG